MEEFKLLQESYKAHCLVFPFPAQGHINPMIQFLKRLLHKNVKATLVTTKFVFKTTFSNATSTSIPVVKISDGYDDGGGLPATEGLCAYIARFRENGSQTLADILRTGQYNCVIYDPHLHWVLDVAKEVGVFAAAFFTQPLAVYAVYYYVYRGLLKVPIVRNGDEKKIMIPGLPPLEPSELPSFINDPTQSHIFDAVVNQFCNLDKADWVLCNTFYELELDLADLMSKIWALGTIGPSIPSNYLDKQIKDDNNYGLNLIKSENAICIEWLNNRTKKSVSYVSFGSVAGLKLEQVHELAMALKNSKRYFLWVVRLSESSKLPENFSDETAGKGLIVPWCPQLEVLSHDSIGCFITHCGWNSTLEALCLGVPLIAMPQWTDQNTNAKYVVDVWKTGIKAWPDEDGLVRKEEIERCIKELMEGQMRNEIDKNVQKRKCLALEAMSEGGSSDRCVNQFIEFISKAN